MKLSQIFARLKIDEKYDFDIKEIVTNTKEAKEDTLFVAIKGTSVDTHEEKYLKEAYDNGCRAFILEREATLPKDSVSFVVENTRKTLGLVAATFYGTPSKHLRIIGITGTKGKTSVSFILKEMLEKLGKKAGVIGTSGAYFDHRHIKLKNTTPDPLLLQKILKEAKDAGVEYICMEVSSQAMKQWRVMGTRFLVTVFTNLSPDHIGPKEHENFEEYRNWKKKFLMLSKKVILNKDDENFAYMTEDLKNTIVTVGRKDADFLIEDEESHRFKLNGKEVKTNLYGSFNKTNLALALACLNEIGFMMSDLLMVTDDLLIPGRVEVMEKKGRKFVIDYAHNKISLENLLNEVKKWQAKKIILVIGTVGGRTFERRREIPEVANKYVDEVIFTSDNPDFEEPEKILEEMAKYSTIKTKQIVDRGEAIKTAFKDSGEGDIILIAGKGNESHQLIKGQYVPYSDRAEVNKL